MLKRLRLAIEELISGECFPIDEDDFTPIVEDRLRSIIAEARECASEGLWVYGACIGQVIEKVLRDPDGGCRYQVHGTDTCIA